MEPVQKRLETSLFTLMPEHCLRRLVSACFSEREVRMFEKMPLSPAQYNAMSWRVSLYSSGFLRGFW